MPPLFRIDCAKEKFYAVDEKEKEQIVKDLQNKPIGRMRIYINQNKLVMLLEVEQDFDIKDGIHIEPKSNKVEEWENIMGTLFQELESGNPRSWELTENIFDTQNYF